MKQNKPSVFVLGRFSSQVPNEPDISNKNYKAIATMREKKLARREKDWTVDYAWYKYVTRDDACLKADIDIKTALDLHNLKEEAIKNLKIKFIAEEREELIDTSIFKQELLETSEYKLFLKTITEINDASKFSGLWDKNGAILNADIKDKLKEFSSISEDQMVFEQVLSLDKKFMESNGIYTPRQFYDAISSQMPAILKSYGFNDPNNINWNAAFHVNTDNLHCHISFWEKEPQFIEKNNNGEIRKVFKKKGEIDHGSFLESAFLLNREFIENEVTRNNIYQFRNLLLGKDNEKQFSYEMYQAINLHIQKSLDNKNSVLKLMNYMKKHSITSYNSKKTPEFIRNNLDDLTFSLLNSNKKMKQNFDAFKRNLRIKQEELINISKSYFVDKYPKLYNFKYEKNKSIYEILKEYKIKKGSKLYDIFSFVDENIHGEDGLFSRIGNKLIKEFKTDNYSQLLDNDFDDATKATIDKEAKKRRRVLLTRHKDFFSSSLREAEQESNKKYNNLLKAIAEEKREIEKGMKR